MKRVMAKIPHERSYDCRRFRAELREIDRDLEEQRFFAQNRAIGWGKRMVIRYVNIPLDRFTRYIASIRHKLASADDELEKSRYQKSLESEEQQSL